MKKNYFWNSQKFAIREIHKIPYENPFFSSARYNNTFFSLHCHYTGYTQYRVWFDLERNYFQNSQKFAIREIRKIP